jgi:phosphomethylpyrimidine synthase
VHRRRLQVQDQLQYRQLGRSLSNIDEELEKLRYSVKYGADTVMDLSTGGDIPAIRKAISRFAGAHRHRADLRSALARAARGGPERARDARSHRRAGRAGRGLHDHPRRRAGAAHPAHHRRITGIVSRGGSILAEWMVKNHKQNLLYECFDDICKIFQKYDVSFSLGDGLRPGSWPTPATRRSSPN